MSCWSLSEARGIAIALEGCLGFLCMKEGGSSLAFGGVFQAEMEDLSSGGSLIFVKKHLGASFEDPGQRYEQ